MSDPAATTTDARLDGRYRLRAQIARGGTSTVWLAEDEVLGRDVAIKVLHPHLSGDPAFVDRFRREALAAAKVSHPHVVTLYDVAADGSYLVMEHVDGQSLRDVLRLRGRLRPAEALALIGPVAAGLSAAHAAGLVHRDVKPENVLLGRDGSVKIGDFGLARAAATASTTFGPDAFAGSPRYTAPEAVRGEALDARADVYALGIVLYEALTGQAPFLGDSPFATAMLHTTNRVPAPSTTVPALARELDEVVARATDPSPSRRYADAGDFADALARAIPEGPATVDLRDGANPTVILPVDLSATLVTTRAPATRARRRPPRLLVVALVAALVAGGGWVAFDRVVAPVTAIPAVVGETPDDARAVLAAAGFRTATAEETRFSAEVAQGRVVAVLPAQEARRGRTVTLVLSAGPRQVDVPPSANRDAEAATAALVAAGLVPVVERAFDEEVPAGLVITTVPTAGTTVDEGSEVRVVVSDGREPITVPDVRELAEAEAIALLRELGLEPVVIERVDSEDLPRDTVVSQSPRPDEVRHRGDQVQLRVSAGPPAFAMPDVRGESEKDAVRQLEKLDLVVTVEYVDTLFGFRRGIVDEQDPPPGREVRAGDEVTLFVWR